MIKEKTIWKLLGKMVMIFGIVLTLGPMYIMIITAFKPLPEAAKSFFALPSAFYIGNFVELFSRNKFWNYAANSLMISTISMTIVVFFVPTVSYAIARNFNNRYYRFLYYYILLGLFVPFQIIMLPLVKQMTKLNLLNRQGLILLYVSFSLIRGVFLFVGYIRAIPRDIEEAAYIDGCNVFSTYTRIIVHLIKPMIATLMIIDILWFWNDFMLPLLLLNKSSDYWTLPLFQYNFKTQYSFNYPMSFTAYFMSMVPIVIIYCFLQKYIITGISAGAVKS
ncbi:MAG: carbohydrate ABC transporter permease [Firmicutes bacterium]|nr:carbohydrate ABC transporter permease [Bacillota bacterium]